MRLVVTIDGGLLVSQGDSASIIEQKAAIASMVDAMGNLLIRGDEIIICYGNAPQVGSMLLRSEAAKHMIYVLPLDICGADTQGATGYMLQQALQNWLDRHSVNREVAAVITQVVVDEQEAELHQTKKGVGPFFDRELAQVNQMTRGWEMAMVPGFGCQRVVPLLMPKQIVEGNSIRCLVERGVITICAGGGGVPVRVDSQGTRVGVEAVVDKAYTAALLGREVMADSLLFVTPLDELIEVTSADADRRFVAVDQDSLDDLIRETDSPILHKLIASRDFLRGGGKSVLIIPPEELPGLPEADEDMFSRSGEMLIFNHRVFSFSHTGNNQH